jgi:hypothetical protein
VGHELQDEPRWIQLQNGYYLPIFSDDGRILFLQKVSSRAITSNTELKRIGSNTPLFREGTTKEALSSLLDGDTKVATVAAAPPASMEAATATLTRPAMAQELAPPQANGFASELPPEEANATGTDTLCAAMSAFRLWKIRAQMMATTWVVSA